MLMGRVLITVKDSSGIRIHYTETLRPYDGGILVNGITISPLHIVPPYQPEYRTAGYCSSHCTQRVSAALLCPHTILSVIVNTYQSVKPPTTKGPTRVY